MEAPVFLVMLYLWWNSSVRFDAAPFLFFLLFELHYFQRSLSSLSDERKEPDAPAIMLMGVVFNVLNGLMRGEWLFYLAPGRTLYRCLARHSFFLAWGYFVLYRDGH